MAIQIPLLLVAALVGGQATNGAAASRPRPAGGSSVLAQTAPIKGATVMGDKDRSGPDGWVQAPVTRDEAPAASQKSAGEPPKAKAAMAPPPSKPMAPGDDPSTRSTPTEGPTSGGAN